MNAVIIGAAFVTLFIIANIFICFCFKRISDFSQLNQKNLQVSLIFNRNDNESIKKIYVVENTIINKRLFGLYNSGMYCYFNAAIQVIWHSKLCNENIEPINLMMERIKLGNGTFDLSIYYKEFLLRFPLNYTDERKDADTKYIFETLAPYISDMAKIDYVEYILCTYCKKKKLETSDSTKILSTVSVNHPFLQPEISYSLSCMCENTDTVYHHYRFTKLNKMAIISYEFDLSSFKKFLIQDMIEDLNGKKLYLKSFIEIIRINEKLNHYVAYVKKESQWYQINDVSIIKTDIKGICMAVVLSIYQ